MTRQFLAGFVGMSPSWVKRVENGQLQAPGLEMILRIAEALRVRNLADLTGHPDTHVDLFAGPGHRRLAAVRAAINLYPFTGRLEAHPAVRGRRGGRRRGLTPRAPDPVAHEWSGRARHIR
ncbi:helix-turn-helix domain-containing protein [Streptomyces sannanensis]|uniref:helix-turn-helix domain-containing protein n=1 Tax=Streptomyces sannanensis TaxID=285536 RepID=UPI003CD0BC9A